MENNFKETRYRQLDIINKITKPLTFLFPPYFIYVLVDYVLLKTKFGFILGSILLVYILILFGLGQVTTQLINEIKRLEK